MNAENAFASPVVRKVAGEDVEFARLTMQDYGTLEAAVRTRRVEVVRAVMDELEGLSAKERLDALRGEASLPVTMWDVDRHIGTAAGAREALKLSLKRAKHPSPESVLNAVSITEAYEIAGLALGLLKEKEPDPPAGGSTGKATPPSSDGSTPDATPAD